MTDELTGQAEHDDFERGAEDMELRAMRSESEDEMMREAYWYYCDGMEQDGQKPMSLAAWEAARQNQFMSSPQHIPEELSNSDDMPF